MAKSERISMPMSMAGIMGFAPDTKLSGIEINAKTVVIASILFIILVKIAAYIIK